MEYYCKICNKKYASYKSLWKHNYIYHKNIRNPNVTHCNSTVIQNVIQSNPEVIEDKYKCSKCNKNFKYRQGKWKHEKICQNKIGDTKIIKLEKQNEEIIKQNQELRELLQKALKIHPKTLQKINKQLNNINNGNINSNNVTNTYNIVQLGNENLNDILSQKQKLKILNRQAMSLNEIVDMVHVSDNYNQFKNVYVTNLQSSFCYKYDDNSKTFIAVNKNELLDDLIDARMYDINTFYEELQHLMSPEKADQLKKFIERMDDGDDNLKGIKKDEIKLILYNKRNKVKSLYEESTNTLEL